MEIHIQGSQNSRTVLFYTPGVPVSSQLPEVPDHVEQAIRVIEQHCLSQQTPEQRMVGEYQEKIDNIVKAFPTWDPNSIDYKAGDVVSHDGILFKVIQAHTSQPNWSPLNVPALFMNITERRVGEETGVPGKWVQPLGEHDSYKLGDKVTHLDRIWESTADNNIWEPGVYGWKEIE